MGDPRERAADLEWEAEFARMDGNDELADDLEWEAYWAEQDEE